jgi:hypothetical protein
VAQGSGVEVPGAGEEEAATAGEEKPATDMKEAWLERSGRKKSEKLSDGKDRNKTRTE